MTKAQNIRNRRAQRGRPKDETCDRTPSGQKSRSNPHPFDRDGKPMNMVGIEARMPHFDLPKKWKGRDDKALEPHEIAALEEVGSVLGRLWLAGTITRAQHQAGKNYLGLYRAQIRYLQPPKALAKTSGGHAPMDWDCPDFDQESYTDRAIRAVTHYRVMRDALGDIKAEATVHLVAILDDECPPVCLPILKEGLALLAAKMGL